jgi:group I intron endonuclease
VLVYLALNRVNGKVYVGKTNGVLSARWRGHLRSAERGSNLLFHQAIRKYGAPAFELSVIGVARSPEELNELERASIANHRSYPPNLGFGYNLSPGGDGGAEIRLGRKHTDATRQKMAEYRRLNPVLVGSETARKISSALKGRAFTPEWSARKSAAQLGAKNSMYGRKDHKPNLGRTLSEEWRSNISRALKARWAERKKIQ